MAKYTIRYTERSKRYELEYDTEAQVRHAANRCGTRRTPDCVAIREFITTNHDFQTAGGGSGGGSGGSGRTGHGRGAHDAVSGVLVGAQDAAKNALTAYESLLKPTKILQDRRAKEMHNTKVIMNLTGQFGDNLKDIRGLSIGATEEQESVFQRMGNTLTGAIDDIGVYHLAWAELTKTYTRTRMEGGKMEENLANTVALMNEFGVSSHLSAEIMDTSARSIGASTFDVITTQTELLQIGSALGKGHGEVAQDFRAAQSMMAYDAQKSIKVFKSMQAVSMSTGMSQQKLNQTFGTSMDTFEGAASVAARLNAALGTQINATELLMADESERIQIIRDAFEDSGRDMTDLTGTTGKYFRDVLGGALNMNREEVGRFFGMSAEEYEMHMKKMQKIGDSFKPFGSQEDVENQLKAMKGALLKIMGPEGRAQAQAMGLNVAMIREVALGIDDVGAGLENFYNSTTKAFGGIVSGWMDDPDFRTSLQAGVMVGLFGPVAGGLLAAGMSKQGPDAFTGNAAGFSSALINAVAIPAEQLEALIIPAGILGGAVEALTGAVSGLVKIFTETKKNGEGTGVWTTVDNSRERIESNFKISAENYKTAIESSFKNLQLDLYLNNKGGKAFLGYAEGAAGDR